MISDNIIRKIIDLVYIKPQRILGGLEEDRKLEDVHLIMVKLLTGSPLKGSGAKLDSIQIKIGFTNIDDDIVQLSKEDLESIISSLRGFDDVIGSWTLVHDIPKTEKNAQWRLSADICPKNARSISIEKTLEENQSRNILCVDFEGVGVFFGNPIEKEKS